VKPDNAKLIAGLIYSPDFNPEEKLVKKLEKKFSPVDYASPVLDFNYTSYYGFEMGSNLKRQFLSFKELIDPAELTEAKNWAVRTEDKFKVKGKRRVNIDPGYILPSKLVLASTKNFYHRIYTGKGIFQEITLNYKGGKFCDYPWTFPDYRTKEYKDILTRIREIYMEQR
jgi:hypothetical protein